VPALLAQIWDEALDPGYAAAAARRRVQPDRPVRRWLGTGLALALVGLLLAAAVVQANAAKPAVVQRRLDLVARIQAQTRRYDAVTKDLTALQAQVDRLKSAALGASGAGAGLDARLGVLGLAAAALAVTGPGLRLTMDDAVTPGPGAAGDPALGHVLDRDLQMVVNGLWAAGAEAVAINGQRLSSLSAIRSAGDAILVDYRPLTRPYVVLAIGDPNTIQASFAAGAAGRGLRTLQQTYGVQYLVEGVGSLSLPAAPGVGLRYATTKEGSP
jgi:uncharacterized protein YlxW (UPF0749 family)